MNALEESRRTQPTVSVVVPVYNGSATIENCLDSLLQQNYPKSAYEIIVVDNNSTDSSVEKISRFPVCLFQNFVKGPSPTRNYGISKSRSEIVAFTDQDCIASPDWLAELVRPYQDPEVGGVAGKILAYTHPDQTKYEKFLVEAAPLTNFITGPHEFLPHLYTVNASYRRCILNRVGGFDTRLITAEDVDLSWRVQLQTGTRLVYQRDAIIYHHHRSTLKGLARQYRQYGFGEILLDTLYSGNPGYPRKRRYHLHKLVRQIGAMVCYAHAFLIQRIQAFFNRIGAEENRSPALWLLIEGSNIVGKIEGLIATRGMRDVSPVYRLGAEKIIGRYFQIQKE